MPPSEDVIGGFFELEVPVRKEGLLRLWDVPDDPNCLFSLARSAFGALVRALSPRRVWLPAYMCRSVSDQVSPELLRYYGVGNSLDPDVGFLESAVRSGDLVLGMNYFGRPPSYRFREWIASRQDLITIEDCAQTIDTGQPGWAQYRIFSPRKVVGVVDGGIIVPRRGEQLPGEVRTVIDPESRAILPVYFRLEDVGGRHWSEWHHKYEAWRMELAPSNRRMAATSLAVLGLADPGRIGELRRKNYAVLDQSLGELGFLPPDQSRAVPFGFPVRLAHDLRDRVRALLWEARIYAFRHFADLPSPESKFPAEHALSRELMTLPCDQRYGVHDMERIAYVVRSAVAEALR